MSNLSQYFQLTFFAEVQQTTGEDWINVNVELRSGSSATCYQTPKLGTQKVGLKEK